MMSLVISEAACYYCYSYALCSMIARVHSHRRYATVPELVSVTCTFAALTFFFFFTFLNICFESIVSDPPFFLMIIMILLLGLDLGLDIYLTRGHISPLILMHLSIIVILTLSWVLENTVLLYLSACVFLRFPEIIYFADIFREQLKGRYPILYQIYILARIVYMLAVASHVFGCLFYLIDESLIQRQYYSALEDNPGLYYQGSRTCFSPIQFLPEIQRYIYAMYWAASLLSTVAYGDIIPANPFENVCQPLHNLGLRDFTVSGFHHQHQPHPITNDHRVPL